MDLVPPGLEDSVAIQTAIKAGNINISNGTWFYCISWYYFLILIKHFNFYMMNEL